MGLVIFFFLAAAPFGLVESDDKEVVSVESDESSPNSGSLV